MSTKRNLIVFITIILATLSCGYDNVLIFNGSSMEPIIVDGQKIFAKEVELDDLERGDILYLNFSAINQDVVKRLIALPGETIEIKENGIVYIDNVALNEPYVVDPAQYTLEKITLKDDEYYVLGDNRNASSDSHNLGPISGDDIKGIIIQ